jgi:central kinetochore subunit Mal2/MCM21
MATTDSSTLTEAPPFNEKHQAMADELDSDIVSIRAEIYALSKQRNLLSSSLLGSTRVQQQLARVSTTDTLPAETQALLSASQTHAQENAHRLALGVTAFPFQDPTAEDPGQRLLGVRFDIADSRGKYDKPYYILAQRIAEGGDDLRVYRHTVPSFIPLRQYEEMYLAPQDEGYGSGENINNQRPTQDLHGLVKHVRHDLISWALRREAVQTLQQQLQLTAQAFGDTEEGDNMRRAAGEGRYGVKGLDATSIEATQIKIEWASGAIGRVRISSKGVVEKAVLFGLNGRMTEAEGILTKDGCSVLDLASTLESVQELMRNQGGREGGVGEDMSQGESEEEGDAKGSS